ncbi:hypothetical protein B0T10DRAFT_577564 [Thelonectria olida]|uniref:4-hydroxy-2-oxoglutarate aldolase, mitochondrial n=1 Tax=Thelonectria olida TaxID=1576542 RepID=A0A9P9AUP9_9HYPO|nr:hypothetical protein B0T10DRAFT_577564 [Thelonectria olida]
MSSSLPYSSKQPHIPSPGVWCPVVTFFNHGNDQLDLSSQAKYFAYLAGSGLTGIVALGTDSEAFLLTREERFVIIATARKAVGSSFPVMAGVGCHSTKQTIQLAEDAAKAGADYVLVLPPAYFGKATNMNVVKRFYIEVGAKSPLPVVIYNCPGVCNGVDMDSETITEIVRESAVSHPSGRCNIVGVYLACDSVGKMTRLSATFGREQLSIFGGQSDFLLAGLAAGSSGAIASLANVFPSLTAKMYKLYKEGWIEEATKLQKIAALAESPCKSGIAATKYAVACYAAKAAGIDKAEQKLAPRHPYEPVDEAVKKKIWKQMEQAAKTSQNLH